MTLHKATVELLNYVLSHKCSRAENYNNQTILARSIFTFFIFYSRGYTLKMNELIKLPFTSVL